MTGFKSKRAMTNNDYNDFGKATWQDFLLAWEREAITKYVITESTSNANQDIISDCLDQMQVLFPGNYTLVWYQSEPMVYHLTVHFKDPKHETMWRMKYA